MQTPTHLNMNLTFDELAASLLAKSNRRELCDAQLGDKEALVATFDKNAFILHHSNFFHLEAHGVDI